MLLAPVRLGDVEGDVGDERRLAHGRAAGEDDQIGRLQAAHLRVEVAEPCGDAGELTVPLVGLGGHVDRGGERVGELLEAAVVLAGLGQFVEAPLRLLDLVPGGLLDGRLVGAVHQFLADGDQPAADGEVIDSPTVLGRVDDRSRVRRQSGEVLDHRLAAEIGIAQVGLHGDRRRQLARFDQRRGDGEDLLVGILHEVLGKEEVRHAVIGVVVDQDGAQQRLLRIDVVRCDAVLRLHRFELGRDRVGQCHRRSDSRPAPERRISHPNHRPVWLTEA